MIRCTGCSSSTHEWEDCPRHPCRGCDCARLGADVCLRRASDVLIHEIEQDAKLEGHVSLHQEVTIKCENYFSKCRNLVYGESYEEVKSEAEEAGWQLSPAFDRDICPECQWRRG